MFLICGEALYDVFPLAETAAGLTLDARMGGSPFNVAIGLARLGRPAGLFAGLSEDPLGRRLEQALAAEGVDTAFLARKPNPTTLAVVGLTAAGVPHYTFYGHGAADRSVTAEDLPTLPSAVTGLHFGSFSLVAGETAETLYGLAERQAGARLISLDPNVRLGVEPDVALWRRRIEAYAGRADLVKVSEEDLEILYPGAAPGETIARWHGLGVRLVVVTRGPGGALASLRGEIIEVAGRRVDTVDTVGAGDSFQAALLAGLEELGEATKAGLARLDAAACRRLVAFAVAAAEVTCSRRGADLPRRAELPAV